MANNVNLTLGEGLMRGKIRINTHEMYASKVQALILWFVVFGVVFSGCFTPTLVFFNKKIIVKNHFVMLYINGLK